MALYQFYCFSCDKEEEINLPISIRDEPQKCECGRTLRRKLKFKGVVYSGTHNGGMK